MLGLLGLCLSMLYFTVKFKHFVKSYSYANAYFLMLMNYLLKLVHINVYNMWTSKCNSDELVPTYTLPLNNSATFFSIYRSYQNKHE